MSDISSIPFQTEINKLFEFLNLEPRSYNPSFYIIQHEAIDWDKIQNPPPSRNDFFEISLVAANGELDFTINNQLLKTPKRYLLVTSPGQIRQWKSLRPDIRGYVTFFKGSFFNYRSSKSFVKDFPFFNIEEANVLELTEDQCNIASFYYQQMHKAYSLKDVGQTQFIHANLQAVLSYTNNLYLSSIEHNINTRNEHSIVAQFRCLINTNFIEKRQVNEYADLLSVTANYLTQAVKQVTDRNAKSFIEERLFLELKYLLKYSDLEIKEIAYRLKFADTSQLHKFFKKYQNSTPTEFRNSTY